MIKMSIRTLLIILIIILLVSVIILQIIVINKIKNKKIAEGNQRQDMLNLMMMNVLNNMNNNSSRNLGNLGKPSQTAISQTSHEIVPQTSFFAKSIDHAEKVLMGKVYLDGYKYGSSIDLTRLDDATKKSAIISMKHMMIDPVGARNIEQRLRIISEQEKQPLWFVILHEAIRKLIPIDSNLNVSQISDEALEAEVERRKKQTDEGNVVSINKVVA